MKMRIILFVSALLIWVLLNWSITPACLITGSVVSFLVACLSADMFSKDAQLSGVFIRIFWFICYLPVFSWECFKANLDGAFRVIHPDLPINPGIVKVKTALKSDIGLTLLANSLTLTPGTMTVDIDKENGCLYVHWVDVKSQDIQQASELIVRKFERILIRIFP